MCCASAPPQEIPSTSTTGCPNTSSIPEIRRARPRKRRGKRGSGDLPIPGTSKRIVPILCPLTLSSASMKGSNSSRLAPRPLISSKGGPLPSPCSMATYKATPLTLIIVVPMVVSLRMFSCLTLSLPVCPCVPVSSLRQQERERLSDQGRLCFPLDLDCTLSFEQQTSLALRVYGHEHHPGADTCSRFHRRYKAHPVEAIIQGLGNARRDDAYLYLHCS